MPRRILITAALPYANGDIHIGHLVEYIQADIWARFQKLRGNQCFFVCADDAHGTPVMLRAEAEGLPPETLIAHMREKHLRDFSAFNIGFDCYHSTHSPENEELAGGMFLRLQERGCIAQRKILQLYDSEKGMFLPDRYVRGECPKCGAPEQYGDSCEQCGAAYSSAELKNPRSTLSGGAPVLKESMHYFLQLCARREELRQWTQETIPNPARPSETIPRLQKEAANKLREWLEADDLRDWDISRDAPYFGFRIPGAAEEKYFYVWLDAPVGYMAAFKHFCDSGGANFDDFWAESAEQTTELYHFIGKDILYFHALFWPVMLKHSGRRRPTRVFAHGFLTVNGEKMSKSRGTYITAQHYLDCGLNPEFLRYYYACKLGARMDDLDLSMRDFEARANGDLVGKLINIPSRVGGFLHRFFGGALDEQESAGAHFGAAVRPVLQIETEVAAAYENRRYHDAMRLLMHAADAVNAHIDGSAPWKAVKDESRRGEMHAVCSAAMRAFDLLMTMLQPVLPAAAEAAADMLNSPMRWDEKLRPLPAGHKIQTYQHLFGRMKDAEIAALIAPPADVSSKTPAKKAANAANGAATSSANHSANNAAETPTISAEDFAKVDLRVAVVVEAEEVAGADKLLRLCLDVGDGRRRQVFSGIKQHCRADSLPGRRVLYLANLKTRAMRFGESEGMILAAADGGKLWLADAPADVPAGARVR